MVDLNRLKGVVTQGITIALGQALPDVHTASRYAAAQHIADTLFRLIRAGGFNEAIQQAKKEPLVEAPVMDLKSSLKTKLICEWVN